MPKRGNRRRRGRGGGRRTPSGANRGRHPSRGNKNRSPRTITQYGDLMDDDNIFIPKTMSEVASNMGRRKYGGMFEEIEYTESHQEDLMRRQLRNRPVEFVKAKEVYDLIEIEESGDEYEDEEDDEEDWDEEELDNEITTKLEALEEAMNNVSSDTESEQSVDDVIEEEEDQEIDESENENQMESEVGTNTDTQDIETLDIIIDLPSNKVESHLTPESEPEYGYLEEDYEFDVSKIEVSNVRFGMIDEQEPEPEPEVYISDSNSEEEEEEEDDYNSEQDDYPYDSDDNLEDLIAYSKTSTQGLIPFEDHFDDDGELQDSLIRQLNNYKANKKLKKHQWEQQKLEESILHHDMLIKYPLVYILKI
ncbi:hypothetical protein FOB64_004500 [Candida albicans]|uniref:Uncharacterized protein n=1 Tax=Candida albicans TaxID=5476 RepID=A0A8H6BZE3_CANAX|nr:hypothetical protein FOB64_004500 [Candida albicans]